MKKSGAGWLRFFAVVCLCGAGVQAEPAQTGEGGGGAPVTADYKARADARLAALNKLSFAELQQTIAASEAAMVQLNTDAQAAREALRDLQEKARAENPEVQAKYRELDEMRAKINTFIDELPDVKAQLEALQAAQAKVLEEAWFRTGALQMAASKDRAEGFPERAEPVDEQPAAPAVAAPQEDLKP